MKKHIPSISRGPVKEKEEEKGKEGKHLAW